jgi:hypothetical protein
VKFDSRLVRRLGGGLSACLLVFIFASNTRADSLYEASVLEVTVPVAAQNTDELKRAAAVGLAEVLVGASGRAEVVEQPAVRAALTSADRYVEQYRYERQPAPENTLVLKLKFAQASIESLLRSAAPVTAGGSHQAVTLTIASIETFPDYARLVAYLSHIMGVRAAMPQSISGNVITVQLRFDGAVEQLTRQLALDHRLLPESAPVDATAAIDATNLLRYRWQGG